MIKENYLSYPAAIKEAMGMKVDYTKLFPIYIAEQTGEGVISVTSDKQAYASGSTFYLTILLEEGYELEELSVVDNNDDEIELTKKSETELPDGSTEIIMFGIMGISPIFANAAGRGGKKAGGNELRFIGSAADPTIYEVNCTGKLTVNSVKNGAPVIATYEDLSSSLSIQADANTEIIIIGDITQLRFTGGGPGYTNLTSIDLSKLATLELLFCGDNPSLTSLDLSGNVALRSIGCTNCTALTSLDLSANVALETLHCDGCTALTEIKYPATNSNVAYAIAEAITAAKSTTGTVYTDSAAAYYSTIATAATTKGWTIAPLA